MNNFRTRMWLPLTSRTCADVVEPQQPLGDLAGPRPSRVDEHARVDDLAAAARIEDKLPAFAGAVRAHEPCARADHGAALGRVDRVEDGEAGIVDPAVRIGEAAPVDALERLADRECVKSRSSVPGRMCRPPR